MQATLDAYALKPFTRALSCLSKYGDDLTIHATPDYMTLAATNSSMSAYCRVKYRRQFFSRYHIGDKNTKRVEDADDVQPVTGQLLGKSLLSILRHRTFEKSVERCELSIQDGPSAAEDDEEGDDDTRDSLESLLIIRLHCKHGVVKTHRLRLDTPTALLAPGITNADNESRLTIGPKPVKDMIDHFPAAKGPKSDPQLIWSFGPSEVQLRSWETSLDSKGKTQLSTELTISAEEFDVYDVYSSPITIAFHLREFNATIAYAESMTLALDMRFTDPASPLFIDVEGDNSETLFIISTSQVATNSLPSSQSTSSGKNTGSRQSSVSLKRSREADESNLDMDPDAGNVDHAASRSSSVLRTDREHIRKPMKAVQRAEPGSSAHAQAFASSSSSNRNRYRPSMNASGSMPPPPSMPFRAPSQFQNSQSVDDASNWQHPEKEPLFLPMPSSQLSVAEEDLMRESGLAIEGMDSAVALMAMLEDEGEEVDFRPSQAAHVSPAEDSGHVFANGEDGDMYGDEAFGADSLDVIEDEMRATQDVTGAKAFKPLFED
ncbi:hypothetical protein FIBSPDRAFT_756546 [Athelia psychrophila]|uniref:Rad9-domain-containing protein n=1 Tax=Athelia psychrophila TaxID=1759441 RepID=A0A166AGY7_9AGAM|nr:hypothetical protein FIBSPDRAFT_756546 [Fibularhizoctonia sp. CBS 109695]